MKNIIFFYLLCCISIMLMWLVTSECDVESQDFRFGIHLLIYITVVLYAPLYTLVACIFYHFKINRVILSKRWVSILYCIFPFMVVWLIKQYCNYVELEIDYSLDDIWPLVFLIQNLLILTHWLIFIKSYRKS